MRLVISTTFTKSFLLQYSVTREWCVMSEKPIPTREELKKLKVVNLRQKLSKLSLPQGGEVMMIHGMMDCAIE